MRCSYTIQELTEKDFENEEIGSSLFSSMKWIKLFKKSYGINYMKLVGANEELLVTFAVIDHAFAKKISILPYCDYVDFAAITPQNIEEVMRFLKKSFPEHDILYKSIFNIKDLPKGLTIEKNACFHLIEYNKETPIKTKPAFRSKVNKARKLGLTTRINHEKSAIRVFYELYTDLRFGKFKSIPQPLSFFFEVWEAYIKEKEGFIIEVLFEEKVIASAIVLKHKNRLYYKYSCSSVEHLNKAPNNLLMQSLTEYAQEHKYEAVDLGLSGMSKDYEGLRSYKESCGGTIYPVNFLGLKGKNNHGKEDNLLNQITKTIVEQKMSMKDTSALSEIIYPYFA